VIEFESVGKTFRDGTAAVVDLSLTVPSDKITVIVGPSGCGKTTTLRMINRMIEPTSGRILWDGSPLRSKRRTTLRRQMGYVIQSGGLFPHRTVLENVGTVPGLLGWDKSKTRKRSIELLDSVGLDRKLADRYPAQLSGGQQQRVGVARALAADPLVMLMDEPFSAVDPVVRSELHELFLDLQRQLSKTIVLITHDIDEAIKLGDQVAILRVGGRLAQVGTPQQLLDEPADSFVEGFVGRDRGYRALSFSSAANLPLNRVKVVRDPASARPGEPTLVIDGDAHPLGWADTSRPGQIFALGAAFDPEQDTLRTALDSALTSPVGLAVAVTRETGRYAGAVSAADILAQVTQSRAALAETASIREAEAEAHHGDYASAPDAPDHYVRDQPVGDDQGFGPDQYEPADAGQETEGHAWSAADDAGSEHAHGDEAEQVYDDATAGDEGQSEHDYAQQQDSHSLTGPDETDSDRGEQPTLVGGEPVIVPAAVDQRHHDDAEDRVEVTQSGDVHGDSGHRDDHGTEAHSPATPEKRAS
jgi:osmoprotectant transport system ATP-binding protein